MTDQATTDQATTDQAGERESLAVVLHDADCTFGPDCRDDPMTNPRCHRQADVVLARWRLERIGDPRRPDARHPGTAREER